MKKFTKRLTMIVAILLSLVLLTSSIVSTTLAKYVVSKSSTTTATLNKFGVEVDFTGIGAETTKKGDSVVYQNTISMHPGDSQTILAKIKGTPSVGATINIDVAITFTDNDFKIFANQDFSDVKQDTIYFPIGFKVGGSTANDTVAPYSNSNATTISNSIETAIRSKLTGFTWRTDNNKSVASWATTKTVDETDISLYLYWPKNYNQGKTDPIFDEIGTYLSNNDPEFTITYIISVEQAS